MGATRRLRWGVLVGVVVGTGSEVGSRRSDGIGSRAAGSREGFDGASFIGTVWSLVEEHLREAMSVSASPATKPLRPSPPKPSKGKRSEKPKCPPLHVHEREDSGEIDILTKGDNNFGDDRLLYAHGQLWLQQHHIMGRAVGFLPYVGWVTIIMTEKPIIKYLLIGALGLLVITSKE
ncbi:hypothetical protein ZIOFF_043932 [Zingiber officinale]|uniref:Signal peptidase complex catalytic subunit SEC11 n=1 Tax=Zingiber officinale TaxID=94328 RepID=A0A8J5G535_ZINOF|nr:hypothetical protein ZIOFF_043932 [Zingiber officinale]